MKIQIEGEIRLSDLITQIEEYVFNVNNAYTLCYADADRLIKIANVIYGYLRIEPTINPCKWEVK